MPDFFYTERFLRIVNIGAEREIYSIFARNYRVLPAIARWLQR